MAVSSVVSTASTAVVKKLGAADLLYLRADQMGLNPSWITPSGVFAITTDTGEHYVHDARSSLNSHVGISLAKNKHLTRLVLGRHNMPNIPYARPKTFEEAAAFLDEHQKIIVKPVRGLGSYDIHIVTDMAQLDGLNIRKYIFEKYIAGKEMRYLILNGTIICVHESAYGVSVAADRPLQRISYPQSTWDPKLIALTSRIANVLNLKFAAIDFLIDSDGKAHILEVNTTPGLKWFHAPSSGPAVDVAQYLLDALLIQTNSQPSIGIIDIAEEQAA